MNALSLIGKIALLLVFPTPKNLKELAGLFNEAVTGALPDARHRYSDDQWAEIRRLRDAQQGDSRPPVRTKQPKKRRK